MEHFQEFGALHIREVVEERMFRSCLLPQSALDPTQRRRFVDFDETADWAPACAV